MNGISDHELREDEKRCMGCGIPCAAIMCARCEREALEEKRYHLDAALGRAVRAIVEGWLSPGMTTATMPIDYLDGRHEVTEAIAEALRKEQPQ